MLKLKSISPSRMKTYDMCPFKYWLTYCCPGIKLKSNWGASHGSLIHDILEHLANGQDIDWMNRLFRGYAGQIEIIGRDDEPELMASPLKLAKADEYKNKKPMCDICPYKEGDKCGISKEPLDKLSGCPKYLFEQSVKMMEETISRYKNDIWPKLLRDKNGSIIGTEYEFNILLKGSDVPMNGIMDLVIEEDKDTIHIIDYKTGSWTQDYQECQRDIQVQMYSLASRREFIDDVNNKGFKYKNVMLTFDYFTKTPITLAFTALQDQKTEEYVKNKIKQIQNTNWIDRIVKNNEEFTLKKNWKCRSICDTEVCAANWKGRFQTP